MAGFEAPEHCTSKPESDCPFNASDILGPATYSKGTAARATADRSTSANQIAELATNSVGHQLWKNSHVPGSVGGAAAASAILEQAGVSLGPGKLSVDGLFSQLTDKDHNWQSVPFGEKRPGDVVVVSGDHMHHVGIVDSHGVIEANSSATGTWSQMSEDFLARAQRAGAVHVLRQPEAKE